MKTLISATLIIATATFSYVPSAFGADTTKGQKIFAGNCAQCHSGGKNIRVAAVIKNNQLAK